MFDLVELYTHWQAGRGQRELAASLGIDRKTIRKYVAPAVAAGITPGVSPAADGGGVGRAGGGMVSRTV